MGLSQKMNSALGIKLPIFWSDTPRSNKKLMIISIQYNIALVNYCELIDLTACLTYFQICSSSLSGLQHPALQTVFIRMQHLSENAIVHISAGFQGPFILQAFGVKTDLYRPRTYNFCVTDGEVYMGATYEYSQNVELENFNLIQVTAKFDEEHKIIKIRSLEIMSTALKRMVGRPPCTLQDYFRQEVRGMNGEGTPRKRIKKDDESFPLHPPPSNGSHKTAKNQNTIQELSRKTIINLEMDKRALKLASESDEDFPKDENEDEEIKMHQDSKSQCKSSPLIEMKENIPAKTCCLKDLYERATGWMILCRVNYLSVVACQNQMFAANFIISDEQGSEMKCVYFVSDAQTTKELAIGHYYLLSGGEVKFVSKEKQLQITFDRNSKITLQEGVHFAPPPGKYKRIDRVLDEEHSQIVNVIGMVRRVKSRQQFKSKTKYTATLADPIKHIEIDFMLFLNNGEKDIEVGMIIVLHNFQVFKQQNIFRLNSTYKSYYFEEKSVPGSQDLVGQYELIKQQNREWLHDNYRNISMFHFTNRTIHDLREIARRTDDERLYSSLDVWALDITKKKSYQACRNCKRPADRKEMGLFECIHCKQMVSTITTHALNVTFADCTGSTSIDVIGEHAESLLGLKADDFNSMNPNEQLTHLESLKFKNVTMRLKSERKADKKEIGHSVWGIEKPSPEVTIRQIKKRLQIHRLKQQESW